MSSVPYRPEIDGLRAFAVLPIVLFHLGMDWIDGGYIGVDVFFVISGYLITSIVARELDEGRFTFRGFWARRVRRILPALSVVCAATLAFTALFVFRGDHAPIARQALAALGSFANVHFWRTTGDYWGTDAEESPFLHTWSLSVEEQFYLLFPLSIWVLHRFRRHWLETAILAVVLASLGAFLFGIQTHREVATFYLLPTRAWELGTGCLLAMLVPRAQGGTPAERALAPLGLLGLGMIVISYFLLPELDGGLTVAIAGTSLAIAFARSGAAHTVLTLAPVTYVGRISYSLYLWHWPVMVFAKRENLLGGGAASEFAQIALVLALSIASFHLVEQPCRKRPGLVPWIAAGWLATVGAAVALLLAPGTYDASAFERPRWCGLQYDLKPRGEMNDDMRRIAATVEATPRSASPTAYLEGGILAGAGDANPAIVVLGDSHGTMWSETVRGIAERLGVRAAFYSMNAISPFLDFPLRRDQRVEYLTSEEKFRYDEARVAFLERWKPAVVIVCQRWSNANDRAPRELLEFLERNAGHVLLMEQPPELAIGNRNALQVLCHRGIAPAQGARRALPLGNVEAWEHGRSLTKHLAATHERCSVFPLADLYREGDGALALVGRDVVYLDDDHLTVFGTELARARLEQRIAELLAAARR